MILLRARTHSVLFATGMVLPDCPFACCLAYDFFKGSRNASEVEFGDLQTPLHRPCTGAMSYMF
jgi:hypothetical protein